MAFAISTPSFSEGAAIPEEFTCDGIDRPPAIRFSDPPERAKSFAVIIDDPDAPGGTYTHLLAYDIPVQGSEIQIAAGKSLRNSFGRSGYGGPCPPRGHGPHRYFFRAYALDVSSLPVAGETRQDLEKAIQGHAVGAAQLMGRYERAK